MQFPSVEIKCQHCKSDNMWLDHCSEHDPVSGRVELVFECLDCEKQTEIITMAFDANPI